MKKVFIFVLAGFVSLSANAQSLSGEQKINICKAAMAAIMFQPVDIISGATHGSNARVSYVRVSDNQRFVYECRYEGDRVVWRTQFGSSWGRWRNDAADSIIRYKVSSNKINITETVDSMHMINQDFTF